MWALPVEAPRASMLERGSESWFYYCETGAQREKEKRRKWLSEIRVSYKEKIRRDFSVSRVLPRLVCDGVFSLREYREILSGGRGPTRVDSFLLLLFSKGPRAFCAFCSHLEELCPYLLTCLFLYYQEQTHRLLRDGSAAEGARVGTPQEPSHALDAACEQSLLLPDKKLGLGFENLSSGNKLGYFQKFSHEGIHGLLQLGSLGATQEPDFTGLTEKIVTHLYMGN